LFDQARVRRNGSRRFEHGSREERPRQDPGKEKQRVRSDHIRRKEEGEDYRVDREQQKRIGERPEKSEDGAAVTRFQIARRERRDELAISIEVAELVHLLKCNLREVCVAPAARRLGRRRLGGTSRQTPASRWRSSRR